MVYAILVLLGRYISYTLDLAGIAGLIIGIGMTADSFVVFFERIKDEIREGRSFRSAVPRGWARARKTILSGNAVTFLAAAVLYFLAVGQVKGFAFTLGLTTILDVVVVFLVTWPLVYLASKSATLAKPALNGLGAVQQIARERRRAAHATGRGVATWPPRISDDVDTSRRASRRRTSRPRRRCAATRLLRPALHRHRRLRGHRQAQALVHDQRRDRRDRPREHRCCAVSPSASTSRAAPRCRCPRRPTPEPPASSRSKTVFSEALGTAPELGGDRRQRRLGHRPDPFRETLNNEEIRALRTGAVRRVPAQGRRRPAQQAGHQRFGGVRDVGRPDHPEGAHRAGGVPGAGRHLHHRALRALHGDRRVGDVGLRPGRHRRVCTHSSVSRSAQPR